jgi:hypothetical protein
MSSQGDYGYVDPDGTYTAGWSGSDASRDRAISDERTGRGKQVRERAWEVVRLGGLDGATWREVGEALSVHHGSASGALSNLHKAGKVERLKERRGGASIYVLPHAVNGRETSPHGRVRAPRPLVDVLGQPDPEVAAAARAAIVQEGYDAGYAEGYKAGEADGSDSGWTAGYEEATAAAVPSNMLDEARREGKQEGRDEVKHAALRTINEALRLASQTGPVQTHNDRCFTIHAACALRLSAKAVQRA